jgi:hypothetical protein
VSAGQRGEGATLPSTPPLRISPRTHLAEGGKVSGRGIAVAAAVLLLLWFLFIREPPEHGTSLPSTTAPRAYVVNPAVLLNRCIDFPYPDDWRPGDDMIYAQITDVEIEPCDAPMTIRWSK